MILGNGSTKDQLLHLQAIQAHLEIVEHGLQVKLKQEELEECIKNKDLPKEPMRQIDSYKYYPHTF